MKIICDTKEQCHFAFSGPRYEGVEAVPGSLGVGDYSLEGLADKVAVERKELSDLVQCLGRERERFERELQRGMALDAFAVWWLRRHGLTSPAASIGAVSTRMRPVRAWRRSWRATVCPSSLPGAAPPPNM